jgi:hypothetical protein
MLADPPAAPGSQQAPGAPAGPETPAPAAPEPKAHNCSQCGSPLQPGQDWCLQCGTGASDSLGSRTPSWRSAAAILSAIVVLVAGAATAAYAALSKSSSKSPASVTAVAQVAPPASSTPVVPPASETPPTATAKIGAPTTIKPGLPLTPVKAPKIQAVTPVPKTTKATPLPTGGTGGQTKATPKSGNQGPAIAGEADAEALVLDTNAASTYNPYNYAAANFGDPSLAIDNDNSTGWTAVVEPTVAPKMAEGVLIDLNTPRKIAVMGLSTTTPGLTVQVYGANGAAPPTSITDPAWVALTPAHVVKKKHARLKLGTSVPASKAAHRFIVLWLSAAPASAVGTPQAPGRVSVNEIALFPRKR